VALSFSTRRRCNDGHRPKPIRVLVSGTDGKIGAYFAPKASPRYDLRPMVRPAAVGVDLLVICDLIICDLIDPVGLHPACNGIGSVLHLARSPDSSAPWKDLLIGRADAEHHQHLPSLHRSQAARRLPPCRRVVYASSIHAVSG